MNFVSTKCDADRQFNDASFRNAIQQARMFLSHKALQKLPAWINAIGLRISVRLNSFIQFRNFPGLESLSHAIERRRLSVFAKRSQTAFDIVSLGAGQDPRKLVSDGLYLDEDTLDTLYRQEQKPLGAIDPLWCGRFGRKLAWRISSRLAFLASEGHKDQARAFAAAWYFPLWCELCTISPARHT